MIKSRNTFLSLGTNQGNKLQNLQNAVNLIAETVGIVKKTSSIYQSKSWGFDGGDFFNICIELSTSLKPEEVLVKLLSIENELGRTRSSSQNYESRIIDIDILLYDNEVIISDTLIIPHPRMLDRKFVLVPLDEIASNQIHPIEKKTINDCLIHCSDTSNINKTNLQLEQSISIIDKYNYIAIEGNIGSGKTSLAKKISQDYNAKLVLERFADNPFLPKFYLNQDRYAFPLEMSFLADRYHQLTDDLSQFDLFKNFIVSDYFIFKSLIFAQVTLSTDEYQLYRKMFDIMYKEITKPDIYIFIYQNTNRLLENIKKRGRDYEQNIQPEYLDQIQNAYINFIKTEKDLNTLVIDVSELDFVNEQADYLNIINQIYNKG